MSSSSHNAAPSALGYLYQSQWPLLELLRRSEERPDCAITLELHDDVAWEQEGTPTELLQLKHHLRAGRGLGDKDVDIWRTIRAWMDTQDVGDPEGPTLTMVTTQTAGPHSAAAALRPPGRDVKRALALLEAAAADSTAEVSAGWRRQFLDLDPAVRATFVARIYLLDAAPLIGDLDGAVRRVLRWALPRGHEDTFMGLLWSWWHAKVVDLLQGRRRHVNAVEVAVKIDELRDQFTRDNLPTLVQPEHFDPAEEASYLDRCFVQQLRWVGTPARLIQKAIIDYYRAYVQTARWIDDDLIGMDELEAFESRLRDEWEREHEWMVAELPADADEDAKRRAGLRLLRETLDRTGIRVRDRYDEAFFCRGKHHELADAGRVGWHPEFADRVEALLLAASQ
ncbi:ABC-three component system protein [Micromonospora globbae]|uniref:ABC-three component system protein n=1 Tax=Micromonospora globbae TaxID=1894969 RepID=UPI0038689AB1|nr:hypothetical protein OH732_00205 [Micromonospora globbae]